MKRSFYFLLCIVTVFGFGISSVLAGSHEDKQPEGIKVTKKDAEHAVRFKFPGSTIESCEVVKGNGHPNWVVNVQKAGASVATPVQVDGVTGKVLP